MEIFNILVLLQLMSTISYLATCSLMIELSDGRRYQASNRSSYDEGKLRRTFHDVQLALGPASRDEFDAGRRFLP